MGMREDHGVDARRIHGKRRPVAKPELFLTLKEPAVDQNSIIAEREQVFSEERQRRRH
jgi:hypothetical protein